MEKEFDILNQRMEKNLETRHTYLMFAFTTSFAAIAALFVVDFIDSVSWICIVPFAVIIPFQARISYARLTHAKMEAYLRVYYDKEFRFLKKQIRDLRGLMGILIAIITNYELFMLTVIIDLLYVVVNIERLRGCHYLTVDCVVITIATIIVFGLATYTFPYGKFIKKYVKEYDDLRIKG